MTPERQRMCHHLVALAQLGHAGAGRCDRPGRLRPERHRSRAADLPAADPDKLVPVADAGGNDVDEDLACGRRRKLVHLEDLDGLPECRDPSRSHPVRRTLLASAMRRTPLWHLATCLLNELADDSIPDANGFGDSAYQRDCEVAEPGVVATQCGLYGPAGLIEASPLEVLDSQHAGRRRPERDRPRMLQQERS